MTYCFLMQKVCPVPAAPTPTPPTGVAGRNQGGRQEAGEELTSDPGKEPELPLGLSPRVFGAGMELGRVLQGMEG